MQHHEELSRKRNCRAVLLFVGSSNRQVIKRPRLSSSETAGDFRKTIAHHEDGGFRWSAVDEYVIRSLAGGAQRLAVHRLNYSATSSRDFSPNIFT
ncbi:hypothetical protein TNCT_52641 [Trichonephila clavata]|uniref:Uncharacterized protein n=1 Tax=Trichonephila clavata TaxID=2740835 RepID=A0A8X6HLU9_TRICU|nr:hypothetical protein TNCT_52641 [Trichonephila clavata]